MGTVIVGLIIGYFAMDWLGRIILPIGIGIFACFELLYELHKVRRDPLTSKYRKAMRREGVSESEIEEVDDMFKQMSGKLFQSSGLSIWKMCVRQFIWSTLIALPFSLIGGAIRVFIIDR